MTRTLEGARIFRGPEGEPEGLLRRFVGNSGTESDLALQRCKDLLIAVTHWIPAPGETQHLDGWRARLPEWFIAACAPEPTEAEAAADLRAWRSLDSAGKARYEAEQPWTLENWLAWSSGIRTCGGPGDGVTEARPTMRRSGLRSRSWTTRVLSAACSG